MSATSRMLGRWRTGGCGCCSGQDSDPRRFKLAERRAVREEIEEEMTELNAADDVVVYPARVSVIDLRQGMRVKLLGQTYEVVEVERTWANERRVVLDQVGGPNRLDLDELEHPYASFELVSESTLTGGSQ